MLKEPRDRRHVSHKLHLAEEGKGMACNDIRVAGLGLCCRIPHTYNVLIPAMSKTSLPAHSLTCLVTFVAGPRRSMVALLRLVPTHPCPVSTNPSLLPPDHPCSRPPNLHFLLPLPFPHSPRPVRLHLLHGPGGRPPAAVQPEGRRWVGVVAMVLSYSAQPTMFGYLLPGVQGAVSAWLRPHKPRPVPFPPAAQRS